MWLINRILPTIPLIVYAGVRLWMLPTKKLGKVLATVFYVLLILAFPAAETISHRGGTPWERVAMDIGYYALPVLLYLVLTILLTDLVIGLLRLTKVLSKQTVGAPRFRRFRLGFVVLVPLAFVLFGIWNFHHLRVKEYSIEIPRRSSSLTRLRIVFASDFHLGAQTASDFMDRFVSLVDVQTPDLILIGGDVLEGDRRDEMLDHFEAQFRRLKSRYGVFAVPGNHEGFGGNRDDFFRRAGMTLLRDAVERVDGAFYIAGRNDAGRSRGPGRKAIAALLEGLPDDLPLILIDHRPTDLDNVSRTRTDIQFSGHTHHGQLFPVNIITNREYELSWGYLKKRDAHFFVTSGIQLWGPRVRTVGHSEILVVDATFE